jgi:hypothetical protein
MMLFLVKAKARRQMDYAFHTESFRHNLEVLSGEKNGTIAHNSTLAYSMERIAPDDLGKIRIKMVRRLLRMKVLKNHRLQEKYYMIAIDMTGYLTFNHKHCSHCLRKEQDGKTIYWYHPVVEAKLITENGCAFSIETEFVENTGKEGDSQDCELKAMYRLVKRLKHHFPQLSICLLLDALYANGPVLELVEQYQWKCIITFKQGSMPDLWRDAHGLRKLQPGNQGICLYRKKVQHCQWVNGVEYQQKNLSVLEAKEEKIDTTVLCFVWLTNIEITKNNYAEIVKGGRLRWTIENEGFNMQKNGGYNMEHPYSEHPVGLQNFYLLLQIAHIINQLIEKGNLLVRKVRSALGSLKNIAVQLLEELRTIKIKPVPLGSFQIRLDTS